MSPSPPEPLEAFVELVRERTGIVLSPSVRRRVELVLAERGRATGAPDVAAYVQRLVAGEPEGEWPSLVNLLTVGKTAFDRYPRHTRALVELVVPALDATIPRSSPFSIWFAACSTGEEVYTLAMALRDSGWLDRRPFRILATDISTAALDHARSGRYLIHQPEALPAFVRRHLREAEGGHVVNESLRRYVSFEHVNLHRPPYPDPGGFQIVVCANVLIYFQAEAAARVVERITEVMAPEAVLMLGGAESLRPFTDSLRLVRLGEAFAYVRGGLAAATGPTAVVASRRPARTPTPVLDERPRRPEPLTRTPVDEGERDVDEAIDEAVGLARSETRGVARETLEALRRRHPEHPRLVRALALLLMDEGDLAGACSALEDAIALEPLEFDLHFYLGQALARRGGGDAAMEALRRALFLCPELAFARYTFGRLLHEDGDFGAAIREYARAARNPTPPWARARLRARAEGSRETFWVDDSYVIELSLANRILAEQREPPLSDRSPGGTADGAGGSLASETPHERLRLGVHSERRPSWRL